MAQVDDPEGHKVQQQELTHLCLWQLYPDDKDHHESNPITENDCIYALCALPALAEPQAIFESVERVYTVWIINLNNDLVIWKMSFQPS